MFPAALPLTQMTYNLTWQTHRKQQLLGLPQRPCQVVIQQELLKRSLLALGKVIRYISLSYFFSHIITYYHIISNSACAYMCVYMCV